MNALIRTATAADRDALIALSHRTISASYRCFLGDEAVDAFLGGGAVGRYVAENIGRCSVLVCDGEIVGCSVTQGNVIDLMMVDPTRHRQGLGTELLRHAEQALWRRFAELRLESFEANEKANAFYRKHGWSELNRFRDKASGVDKILFHKRRTAERVAAVDE